MLPHFHIIHTLPPPSLSLPLPPPSLSPPPPPSLPPSLSLPLPPPIPTTASAKSVVTSNTTQESSHYIMSYNTSSTN